MRSRSTTRQSGSQRRTPSAMKRVGGGYVMREAPNVPSEPVRPRMTEVEILKKKNEALSRSLAEKTTQLDSAMAKIRQLEIEGATAEEDLDMVFYYYLEEEEKRKEAEKRVEEVEKCFSHVVESLYLRTSKVPQMKQSLGKMQVLVETAEEEVDGSIMESQLAGIVACEASGSDSTCGLQELSSEEAVISRGEEEDYWFWKEPPGWPHFAIQDGVQGQPSGSSGMVYQDEDPSYWEWPEEPELHHFAAQDGIRANSIKEIFMSVEEEEEEEEKEDENEPPEWPHFAVQDGMPALYSEDCYKFYEDEEAWSEDPEWLHCAVQDASGNQGTKEDKQQKKREKKKIGILFNLLKGLITPFRMIQKLNQDYKRQSRGYNSSKSWIDLQESFMDGIISSSKKKWTKQEEL